MAFVAAHWLASIMSLISVTGLGALSFFFPAQALGVLSWVMRQRLSTLGCIVLLALLIIDHSAVLIAHRHSAKVEAQLVKCGNNAQQLLRDLARISASRNQQRVITQDRIKTVIRTIHDADESARRVETAPPAPACHTSSAVMNADV